jgi:hypothetical protein
MKWVFVQIAILSLAWLGLHEIQTKPAVIPMFQQHEFEHHKEFLIGTVSFLLSAS